MKIEKILDKIIDGERLSDCDALTLFESHDLIAIGAAAHKVRLKKHPEPIVTYIIDRNINYTNICVSGCEFCAYYKSPDQKEEGFVITQEQLFEKIKELKEVGGELILMQGGLHPDLKLEYYKDLLKSIKQNFQIHLHCFSPPEIIHFAKINNLNIEEVILQLKESGLDSIPGGGAEILVENIRKKISPNKCTADQWIEVMTTAHKLGMKTTATMMFGHIESYKDRVEHLSRIRTLQDETSGFTAFIPWTFQSKNTRIDVPTAGGFEYLKTLAICRLCLDNIDNIQASWVTQGAKIAQIALFFGANDLGGTMMEENVVKSAGANYRISISNIELLIKEAGFKPARRNLYYKLF